MKHTEISKRTLFEANNLVSHLEAQLRKKDKELESANECWQALGVGGKDKFKGIKSFYTGQIEELRTLLKEQEKTIDKLLALIPEE